VAEGVRFTTAAGMSAVELAELLVASFAGYRYPPAPDPPAQMRERLATEDLRLDASVVALDGRGRQVGLSLLAARGEESWCGGFGLVPGVRGRRLAGVMMVEQARLAAAAGARRLRLEVLEGNEPALRAYLGAGFRRVRDVGLWRRDGRQVPGAPPLPERPAADVARALAGLATVRHAWQRQPATLGRLAARPGVRGAVWPNAAAIWRAAPWGGTMLLSVVASGDAAARAALGALTEGLPSPLTLFNEPEGTPVDRALRPLGFTRYDRQHELVLEPLP
jgi:RimJ/RimL family protein N-acetyltransferase